MRTLGILILTAAMAMGQQTTTTTAASIAELEAKLAQLRTKYSPQHPEVLAMRGQLDDLKARLALELVHEQTQARAQQDQLKAHQAELQARQAKFEAERLQQEQKLRAQIDGLKTLTGPANLPDTWWRNSGMAKQIGLSPAQVKRMDEVFQQSRLKLIDQKAVLDKEEAVLEPLIGAETLDEGKAASQIDRVAQARAELEKTRGRLLLGIRKQLEPEQWRKLNETRFTVDRRQE